MAETVVAPHMIARFEWKQVETDCHWTSSGDEYCDYDEVCIDRLTGRAVVRYDLGDPANYAKSHGGWTKREYLEKKGIDPDAEIDVASATVPIPEGEAERHAAAKARKAKRDEEEAAAQDLMSFLGADADKFDFDEYSAGEHDILRPALERRGYTSVGFYMIEEDSFGPLIRGCRATGPDGKPVRFFYG